MKDKLAILVTGQFSRLELLSKIEKIVNPLFEKYKIFLVLSLSKTEYTTNLHKYKKNNDLYKSENFKSKIENKKKIDIVNKFLYIIHNITYPELEINEYIFRMYDKRKKSKEYKINRAYNHIRQYYTLYDSWETIKKINPDILVRIREDAILCEPLKLEDLEIPENSILTPQENRFKGINDKFAIVSKKAIDTHLKKPYEVYCSYENNCLGKKRINNPEQFLKRVYNKYGISLLTSDININISRKIYDTF